MAIGPRRVIIPVHGIHYVQDHYSVLGGEDGPLPRDASIEDIERARRRMLAIYHPDRIPDGIKDDARRWMNAITFAADTLLDPERRKTYDVMLAEFEEKRPKYVSKDGTPIIDFYGRHIDFDFMVSGDEWDEKEDILDQVKKAYGYNEETFNIIESGFKNSEDPSPELRKAYIGMLEAKFRYLGIKEKVLWEAAGITNQTDVDEFSYDFEYVLERRRQIESVKEELGDIVVKRLELLESGMAPRLLTGPDGAIDFKSIEEKSVEELSRELGARAIDRLDESAPELEKVALEISQVMGELSDFTLWEYYPPEQKVNDKLLIMIEEKGDIVGGFSVTFDDEIRSAALESYPLEEGMKTNYLSSDEGRRFIDGVIESGMTATLLHLDKDIGVETQLGTITKIYGYKLLKNHDSTLQCEYEDEI